MTIALFTGQAVAPRPQTADGEEYRKLLQQGQAVDTAMHMLGCPEEDIKSYMLYCTNFGIDTATGGIIDLPQLICKAWPCLTLASNVRQAPELQGFHYRLRMLQKLSQMQFRKQLFLR